MIERLRGLIADPSVRWLAASRVIAILGAPVTLWLVVTRLAPEARGFYLIAVNVVALGSVFEMGMGTLLVQFVAHAHPEERSALRVSAQSWFESAATLLMLVLGVGGPLLLAARAPGGFWSFTLPWSALVLVTAVYVMLVPRIGMAEGSGASVAVQRMRAVQALLLVMALWVGLALGGALVTAAAASLTQLAAVLIMLPRVADGVRSATTAMGDAISHRYRGEQTRASFVWLALWGAPQLLTPVVLRITGAAAGGSVGVHLSLALAPLVLSVAWLHGRYPRFGALVAAGDLSTFDRMARQAMGQAVTVFVVASLGVGFFAFMAPILAPVEGSGLFSTGILSALLLGSLGLVLLQAMLAWLRAFAEERFGRPVILACAAMLGGGSAGAAVGGVACASYGYAAGAVVGTMGAYLRFRQLRRERFIQWTHGPVDGPVATFMATKQP